MDGNAMLFNYVVQGGSFALLAFIVIYGARVIVPKFIGSYKALSASIDDMKKVLARLGAIIILHDATVRGENPETVGTTEELMNRIMNGERNNA